MTPLMMVYYVPHVVNAVARGGGVGANDMINEYYMIFICLNFAVYS